MRIDKVVLGLVLQNEHSSRRELFARNDDKLLFSVVREVVVFEPERVNLDVGMVGEFGGKEFVFGH